MKIIGNHTEDLKQKAIREASEILIKMFEGNSKELFKYTQLSWRFTRSYFLGIEFRKYKKHDQLFVPNIDKWQIEGIQFHTPIMIDVFARLGHLGVYRIRMVAEKKPYITDPTAPFRYNPNSLKLVA